MPQKPKTDMLKEPKRLNRAVGVAQALSGVLDPALKRRGFASRDVITHWQAMAPKPYDRVAMPDKLAWPRGERSAEGATLYLRCVPGHQLALTHEAPRIAAAVNRYFGYVLVGQVRLAAMPFVANASPKAVGDPEPPAVRRALVGDAVSGVEDARLRAALTRLGFLIGTQRR